MEQMDTLPDGSSKEYKQGISVGEIALDISPRLRKAAVAGIVDGELVDLSYRPRDGSSVRIVTEDTEEGLSVIRHTAAHVMAQAVARLFDGVKLAIGPAIEDGFYYDFDLEHRFTPEDLEAIEAEMRRIVEQDLPIARVESSKSAALEKVRSAGQNIQGRTDPRFRRRPCKFYSRGVRRLVPGPAWSPQDGSRHSSCSCGRLLERQKRNKMLSASTEQRSPSVPISSCICPVWKRPRSVTIGSSARTWICSACTRRPGIPVLPRQRDDSMERTSELLAGEARSGRSVEIRTQCC